MKLNYLTFKISSPKVTANQIPNLISLAGWWIFKDNAKKLLIWKTKKQVSKEVLRLHKQNENKLSSLFNWSVDFWKNAGDIYIKEIEKILGSKIEMKKTVYFTPLIHGAIAEVISRKNVFIGLDFERNNIPYIVLHEITHLHYADKVNKLNLSEAGKSPLMEGVDHLILFKTPMRELFFPKTTINDINFYKRNKKFMDELIKVWVKRKNFTSFLKKAIIIQRNHSVEIC